MAVNVVEKETDKRFMFMLSSTYGLMLLLMVAVRGVFRLTLAGNQGRGPGRMGSEWQARRGGGALTRGVDGSASLLHHVHQGPHQPLGALRWRLQR